MSHIQLFYELSDEADSDLEVIFDYTAHEYGLDQAVKYVSGFDDLFEQILQNPMSGRERKEIRVGLRSFIKDSHIIFYRVLKDRVRIVRILRGSRDLPKLFSNEQT